MILNHQGYPIVGDDFPTHATEDGYGTGYEARDYDAFPMHGLACSGPPSITRLSEKEIIERIIEHDAKKSWATDIADASGLVAKNQSKSNYCWIHAPVKGMEYCIMLSGAPIVVLSAFYAGSQIKHGANSGGSGIVGVKWLAEHGTCPESMWEPMKFRGTVTPEIQSTGERRQITRYEDFDPKDKQLIYSSIVLRQLVTVGIPAWGHEVLLSFLTLDGGKKDFSAIREGFDNSWGQDWGKGGRGVLEGAKRRFDEAGRIAAVEQAA